MVRKAGAPGTPGILRDIRPKELKDQQPKVEVKEKSRAELVREAHAAQENAHEGGVKQVEQADSELAGKLRAAAGENLTATAGGIKGAGTGLSFHEMQAVFDAKAKQKDEARVAAAEAKRAAVKAEATGGAAGAGDVKKADGTEKKKKLIETWPDTIGELLANPNFFGELKTPGEYELRQVGASQPEVVDRLNGGTADGKFFDGSYLRVKVAGMVDRDRRTDGDFRNAYSDTSFRNYMRADATLQAIPKGELADRLDMDLVRDIQKAIFVDGSEQTGLKHRVDFMVGRIRRGGMPVPGELRKDRGSYAPVKMTEEVTQAFDQHGVRVHTKAGKSFLEYVHPQNIEKELNSLLDETRQALKNPESDPFAIAARFEQRFIAIHPFEECNGRVARLMMYRILEERGIPQPIMDGLNHDIDLSSETFQQKLKEGVARSMSVVGDRSSSYGEKCLASYTKTMLGTIKPETNAKLKPPENQPITIDGLKFAQGKNGFIYDQGGRSYNFDAEGNLQPVPQMNHYAAARRLGARTDKDQALLDFTARNRRLFANLCKNPEAAAKVTVASDTVAMKADNKYRIELPPTGNKEFVALFDVTKSESKKLFATEGSYGKSGTDSSFCMSRYSQIDLEMWHAQKALERAGDKDGVKQMLQHRSRLFEKAKHFLGTETGEKAVKGEDNPLGFTKGYEQAMYDKSPLRHASFEAYRKKENDDTMTLWQGAMGFVDKIGMHPDNNPRTADAMDIGDRRQKQGGTHNLIATFEKLEGSAKGAPAMCTTSDLALLAKDGGFADKSSSGTLKFDNMPKPVADLIKRRLKEGETLRLDSFDDLLHTALGTMPKTPKDHVNIKGFTAEKLEDVLGTIYNQEKRAKVKERFDQALESGGQRGFKGFMRSLFDERPNFVKLDDILDKGEIKSLRARIGKDRDLMVITRSETSPDKEISITIHRRAYEMEVDKENCMPGIQALAGTFVNEQEVHVLERVWFNRVDDSMTQTELNHDRYGEKELRAARAAQMEKDGVKLPEIPEDVFGNAGGSGSNKPIF